MKLRNGKSYGELTIKFPQCSEGLIGKIPVCCSGYTIQYPIYATPSINNDPYVIYC